MTLTFDDRLACADHLRERLPLGTPELPEALIAAFVDACEQDDGAAPPRDAFHLQVKHWVIRDDDLELFAVVKDAFVALASGQFLTHDVTAAGLTSIVIGTIQLFRNVRRGGATLNHQQLQIVLALKALGKPVSAADLHGYLRFSNSGWPSERVVQQTLQSLQAVRTRRGLVTIADITPDGEWWLTGV